jgi:hypothetical protein
MISRTCASASEGCAEAKSGGAAAAASDRGRVSRSTSSLVVVHMLQPLSYSLQPKLAPKSLVIAFLFGDLVREIRSSRTSVNTLIS